MEKKTGIDVYKLINVLKQEFVNSNVPFKDEATTKGKRFSRCVKLKNRRIVATFNKHTEGFQFSFKRLGTDAEGKKKLPIVTKLNLSTEAVYHLIGLSLTTFEDYLTDQQTNLK